jgi:NADH-quinone oxidoreductase subunit A
MHPYLLILAFFSGGLLFVALGYGLSRVLQTQKPNPQKLAFYECGEEPSVGKGSRFNLRFFLPAVLFLLFEIEIVLVAPVVLARLHPAEGADPIGWNALIRWEVLLFLVVLFFAYALALGRGYLNWEKPEIKPPDFQGPVPDFAYEQYNLEQENARLM